VEQFNLAVSDVGKAAIPLVDAATIIMGTPTVLARGLPTPKDFEALARLAEAIAKKQRDSAIMGGEKLNGTR
jgi:hypothetical protein